ncbi:hypothetical protein QBC41DRAFT_389964 [Cercophora samala]|uniref:Uncharacterized protein n=1 Tax=Cercophora samala TaxID=330535 RepID=A0AA39YDT7_9PEZI|nr:hypothetical protein QBC41DRAFT_389964 [Cercophora samala]
MTTTSVLHQITTSPLNKSLILFCETLRHRPTSNGWQDVVDAIEKARNADSEKAKRSVFWGCLRKSKVEVGILESLTGIIPEQDGLNMLRCGLGTVLNMVAVRLELRETILGAFEDIPDTFAQALKALSRFPDASDLFLAVRELYSTLLLQVDTLIRVLLRNHPQKCRMRRLWSQLPGKEAEVVRHALEEVSRAANRVSQYSQAALEQTVGNIDRKMDRVLEFGDSIMSAISQVRIEEREIQPDIERMVRTVVQDTLDKWRPTLPESNPPVFYLFEPSPQTSYLSIPGDQSPASPVSASSPGSTWSPNSTTPQKPVPLRLSPSPSPSPTTTPGKTLRTIYPWTPTEGMQHNASSPMSRLGVSEGLSEKILDEVIQGSSRLRPDAISRGMLLLSTKRFLNWVQAPRWYSDMILVDGHCADAAAAKVSPMTAVCAHVVTALRENPSVIVLHHFCGQHTSLLDPLGGPSDDDDVPTLCQFFGEVLMHLDPAQPVFVIVDGVTELETILDGWWDDLCNFVEGLLRHVNTGPQHRKGPALRVMLTSMERATRLADDGVIPLDRRVSLIARRIDHEGFGTDP